MPDKNIRYKVVRTTKWNWNKTV